MSGKTKTLNQENSLSITAYLIINVLIFVILKLGLPINNTIESMVSKLLTSATWLLILGIFTQIINSQFSSSMKAVLVFWRFKEPLPGYRAFSYFIYRDPRIDPNLLKAKLGNLPSKPMEQNRLWYKLYKKHESKKAVIDAHQKFLLTRDLASSSFLCFIFLGIPGYFFLANTQIWRIYAFILLIMFIIISNAARHCGEKLVGNVLAEESSI
ncbi:hypothetical protein [Scytonema sp. NUACC26]|uniref:hypothetical protein n=1 Tax=Scytonema sp. NUACC26 TaxID=3140176 RepID=UPI0034DBA0F9